MHQANLPESEACESEVERKKANPSGKKKNA